LPTMQAATKVTAAAAMGTLGKPAAMHLLKSSSSAVPPKPGNSRISGVNLQLHMVVAVVSAFSTLAANSRSRWMKRKQTTCHTMNADVTETLRQRQPCSEQPIHWTKPLAAVVLLALCSFLFINSCLGLVHSHHDSNTILHTLSSIVILRQLRRLRL